MQKLLLFLFVCLLTTNAAMAQIAGNIMPRITGTAIDIANHEGDGFKAEYYNGANFERKVLTRVDKKIDFFLINRSPLPGVDADYFSVRWTGKLYAPRTGNYKLIFIADDGVRLWLNGKLLINEWSLNRATAFYGKIHLAGKQVYDLKIEYSQMKPSAAIAKVMWAFENEPEMPIASKYLFSSPKKIVPVAVKKPATPVKKEVASKPKPKTPVSKPAASTEVARKKTPPPAEKKVIAQTKAPQVKKEPEPKVTEKKQPAPPVADNDADVPETTFENLEANKNIVLNHIFFDQSKHDLRTESFEELNKLANTLYKYPAMRILIVGHTDNVGDFNLNVQLSKDRAKAVADYLIAKGIAAERVEFKGFGGMYPLAPNTSEENKVKNRRVEFVVK